MSIINPAQKHNYNKKNSTNTQKGTLTKKTNTANIATVKNSKI
jgi:hypothetical protein